MAKFKSLTALLVMRKRKKNVTKIRSSNLLCIS